MTLKIHSKKH